MNLKIPAPKGFRIDCVVENKLYSFKGHSLWELNFETQQCVEIPIYTQHTHRHIQLISLLCRVVYSQFNHSLYIFNCHSLIQFSLRTRTLISTLDTSSMTHLLIRMEQPRISVHTMEKEHRVVISDFLLPELAPLVADYLAEIWIENMCSKSIIINDDEVIEIKEINDVDIQPSTVIAIRGITTVYEKFGNVVIESPIKKTVMIQKVMNYYVDSHRVWYQNVEDGSITYFDL